MGEKSYHRHHFVVCRRERVLGTGRDTHHARTRDIEARAVNDITQAGLRDDVDLLTNVCVQRWAAVRSRLCPDDRAVHAVQMALERVTALVLPDGERLHLTGCDDVFHDDTPSPLAPIV